MTKTKYFDRVLWFTHSLFHWCCFSSVYNWCYHLYWILKTWRCLGNKLSAKDVRFKSQLVGQLRLLVWKRSVAIYEIIFVYFSQRPIFWLDLKERKNLKLSGEDVLPLLFVNIVLIFVIICDCIYIHYT